MHTAYPYNSIFGTLSVCVDCTTSCDNSFNLSCLSLKDLK